MRRWRSTSEGVDGDCELCVQCVRRGHKQQRHLEEEENRNCAGGNVGKIRPSISGIALNRANPVSVGLFFMVDMVFLMV